MPDDEGLDHFLDLFSRNKLDERKLVDILKNSKEYLIRSCFLEVLNKEPKEGEHKYYVDMMEKEELDKEKLIIIIKNTEQYKRLEFRKRFSKKYYQVVDFTLYK
ncbi:MAG: hypothetical protein D4R72_06100 [Nitrosopumilales archaeon]|nr:MAG: hypothetical protein D4R72_06100 [Nitrosopumilales archaeon]